jgi:hypothetical protein
MIPSKPSSKEAVACVGELVGGILVGCSRRPTKFVVGIAPKGFGLGDVEDADHPSVKVCGACNRHVDQLAEQMEASSPESHRTQPMVFTLNELLEVWDDFFEDLLSTVGGEWEADGQFR